MHAADRADQQSAVRDPARPPRICKVQELVVGASNKYTADEQLDQIALLLDQPARRQHGAAHGAHPQQGPRSALRSRRRQPHPPRGRSRRPAPSPNCARPASASTASSSSQHDSRTGLDMFQSILTTLDPAVELKILMLPPEPASRRSDASHVDRGPGEAGRPQVIVEHAQRRRSERRSFSKRRKGDST